MTNCKTREQRHVHREVDMARQWLRAGLWGAAIGLLATAGLAWLAVPAKAQRSSTVATCGTFPGAVPAVGTAGIVALDQNGNTCVAGSISTSIAGFAPAGTFATLTASGSSASVALPAGAVVIFQNTGTTAVSCTLGVGSATALVNENIIQPGSWAAYTVGSNTFGACIDQTGSASNVVVLSGGTGIPTGAGGGSSGGGGAVTVADGADVAQGTTTDAACATDNGTCTEIQLLKRANQRLTTVNTTLGSPLQAGGSVSVSNANANGSATSANSSPVVIASDQVAVATKAASGALASGAVVDITNMSATTAGSAPTKAIYSGCRGQNTEATAVTNGQITPVACDLTSKVIMIPYANPENFVSGTTAAMTGTTSTSLVASPGGSLRNYITHISCVNSHASVGTFVTVQDGSGGTALMTLAAGSVYGGESVGLPVPLRQPTAATALFVANVTTGANVICNAIGYKGL